MAFELISKALALILISKLHGCFMDVDAMAVETTASAVDKGLYPLPVYDAKPDQLHAISKLIFTTIPTTLVNTWPDTVNVVMRGQGVEIQRTNEGQAIWTAYAQSKPRTDVERDIASDRNWLGPAPNDVPQVLDKSFADDANWVQFTRAKYPIDVPHDVNHVILWLRGPMTTRKTFEPRNGDTLPDERWLDENHLDDVIEFIHAHDAFGTNLDPTTYDAKLKVGEKLWAAPQAFYGYQGKVGMEEGIKAISWSGRHITTLIQAKFPGKEFVWFRVNRVLRNFHAPNEIHVLILGDIKDVLK